MGKKDNLIEKLPAAGLLSLQPGVWSSYFSG